MLIQCYQDEDEYNQEELVKNLAKEHMIWAKQAYEIMFTFKNQEIFVKLLPFLLNRIVDRHNRFLLVSHFLNYQSTLLTKVYKRMSQAFQFSFWNPNCHYCLNLQNQVEREIAMTLIVMNKEASKKVASGEKPDRSQMGNKSCFRNEKFNSQIFVMSNEWILP